MKVLIYSGMFLALTTTVCAGDMLGERLLKILSEKPKQPSSESFDVNSPFGHAQMDSSVEGASSILGGVSSDPVLASEENLLDGATPASPVSEKFKEQEVIDDQQYGALSGTGPNEDESTRYKTDLDLKLGKVKPEAKVLD
ncbi:MAG: hypothetical protein WCN27_02210, partial [Alphaproteobacteria bacterium]